MEPVPNNPNSFRTVTRAVLLFRLQADGKQLDDTFGSSGVSTFRYNQQYGNAFDQSYGMALDASGRILVSGNYGQYRFSAEGTFDAAFGGSGYAQRNI